MKRQFIYIVMLLVLFSFGGAADSFAKHRAKPHYKRVVVVKPIKPQVYVHKHIHLRTGYVWLDGHWKYNRRTHNYVWVKGQSVKKKRGKIWVSGRWVKTNRGWTYKTGFWA